MFICLFILWALLSSSTNQTAIGGWQMDIYLSPTYLTALVVVVTNYSGFFKNVYGAFSNVAKQFPRSGGWQKDFILWPALLLALSVIVFSSFCIYVVVMFSIIISINVNCTIINDFSSTLAPFTSYESTHVSSHRHCYHIMSRLTHVRCYLCFPALANLPNFSTYIPP